MSNRPTPQEIDDFTGRLEKEAAEGGYNLNPDREFTRQLAEALLINVERYGYGACPCRLATGERDKDLDIICPCDYRDPDLSEYGACYCALYVSDAIAAGEREAESIPERRPPEGRRPVPEEGKGGRREEGQDLAYPVWRCRVCGYLCARDEPPEKCPVCKADRDRFERFL